MPTYVVTYLSTCLPTERGSHSLFQKIQIQIHIATPR